MVVLLLFAQLSYAQFGGGTTTGGGNGNGSNVDYIDAYSRYMTALSNIYFQIARARLTMAQAEYTRAVAAQQWEQAKMLAAFRKKLEKDLWRLDEQEKELIRERKILLDIRKKMAPIAIGRTSDNVFSAFNRFTMRVSSFSSILTAISVEIEGVIEPKYFKANKRGAEAVEFSGGTVGDLWAFIEDNNYSMKKFGKAHVKILMMFDSFAQSFVMMYEQINAQLDEIRAGTFDIWNPPVAGMGSQNPPFGGF